MNIVSVEGIAGSGKSEFSKKLQAKIYEHYGNISVKNFAGHNNMAPIMDRLVLGNGCAHISPYTLQVADLYLCIEKELGSGWMRKDIVIFKQYVANLYARLKNGGLETDLLQAFERFPAKISFVLECDPETAYENCCNKRAISYWETDFAKGTNMDETRDGMIAFYRGEISIENIKASFIKYYTRYYAAILEHLAGTNHVIIPAHLSMEEKVNLALEMLQKTFAEE